MPPGRRHFPPRAGDAGELPEQYIPDMKDFLAKKEALRVDVDSYSGAFIATLITITTIAVVAIGWITWNYFQNKKKDLLDGKKKGSVANTLANAMTRARAVCVWLRAMRFVQAGITDDHFFKSLMRPGYKPTNAAMPSSNPFAVRQPYVGEDATEEELFSQQEAGRQASEQNLAIVIAVDTPCGLFTTADGQQSSFPSVHDDGEQIALMFANASYFGSRYKTCTFSSKSITPTSKNLTEMLEQLAVSKREWNQVFVFISAPARSFLKDFLDTAIIKNEFSDFSEIKEYRRKGTSVDGGGGGGSDDGIAKKADSQGSQPVESTCGYVGNVGIEFLGDKERAEDDLSWIDLALFLERLRVVTRRSADDSPIGVLLDLQFLPTEAGLNKSLAFLRGEQLTVSFPQTPSSSSALSSKHSADSASSDIVIPKEELVKFYPDATVLKSVEAMSFEEVLAEACGTSSPSSHRGEDKRIRTPFLHDQLHIAILACGNSSRLPRAANRVAQSAGYFATRPNTVAASQWTNALLQAFQEGNGSLFGKCLPSNASQHDSSYSSTSMPNPFEDPMGMGMMSVPTTRGTVRTSGFHYGLMSLESVATYLQNFYVQSSQPRAGASVAPLVTLLQSRCAKASTMPSLPLPMFTQVAMMPRPLQTRPSPNDIMLCGGLSEFETELVNLLRGRSRAIDAAVAALEKPSPHAIPLSHLQRVGAAGYSGNTDPEATINDSNPQGGDDLPAAGESLASIQMLQIAFSSGADGAPPLPHSDIVSHVGKSLAWNNEVLRIFSNGVLLVNLGDFHHSVAPLLRNDVSAHQRTSYLESLVVDVVGYLCRLASVPCQAYGVHEAVSVFQQLFLHPEAKYLIMFDHCPNEHIAEMIGTTLYPIIASEGRRCHLSTSMSVFLLKKPFDDNREDNANKKRIVFKPNETKLWHAVVIPPVSDDSIVESVLINSGCYIKYSPVVIDKLRNQVAALVQSESNHRSCQDGAIRLLRGALARNISMIMNGQQGWSPSSVTVSAETEAVFAAADLNAAVAAALERHVLNAGEDGLNRLRLLQSIQLTPRLFSYCSVDRIPLHLVRLVALIGHSLPLSKTLGHLKALSFEGLIDVEYGNKGTDSTLTNVMLEDTATVFDAQFFVRLNPLLREYVVSTSSGGATYTLDNVLCNASLHAASTTSVVSVLSLMEPPFTSSAIEVLELVRRNLMQHLLTMFTDPEKCANTAVSFDVLHLAAELDGKHVQSLRSALWEATCKAFAQPWFVARCSEHVAVGRVLHNSKRLLDVIEAHTTATNDVEEKLRAAALTFLTTSVSILDRHIAAVHRNPRELWTLYALNANYFALQNYGDKKMQEDNSENPSAFRTTMTTSPVLTVECNEADVRDNVAAYDGSMLLISNVTVICSEGRSAVTSILFTAQGTAVVGRGDGSLDELLLLTERDNADTGSPSPRYRWIGHIDGAASGHDGEPITDLLIYRKQLNDDNTATMNARVQVDDKVLISASRSNRLISEWNSSTLFSTFTPLERLDSSSRRVWFPAAECTQEEAAERHRFYAKAVRVGCDGAAVAETQFGKKMSKVLKDDAAGSPVQSKENPLLLILQYGLPDMYRNGQIHESAGGRFELNVLALSCCESENKGLVQCVASFSFDELDKDVTVVECGEDVEGHLVVLIGKRNGEVVLVRIVKEL